MKIIKLFHKKSCPKCPSAEKMLMDYGEENNIKIEYYDVETELGLEEASYLDVASTPTVLIFRDGEEIRRITGFIREEDLE